MCKQDNLEIYQVKKKVQNLISSKKNQNLKVLRNSESCIIILLYYNTEILKSIYRNVSEGSHTSCFLFLIILFICPASCCFFIISVLLRTKRYHAEA